MSELSEIYFVVMGSEVFLSQPADRCCAVLELDDFIDCFSADYIIISGTKKCLSYDVEDVDDIKPKGRLKKSMAKETLRTSVADILAVLDFVADKVILFCNDIADLAQYGLDKVIPHTERISIQHT